MPTPLDIGLTIVNLVLTDANKEYSVDVSHAAALEVRGVTRDGNNKYTGEAELRVAFATGKVGPAGGDPPGGGGAAGDPVSPYKSVPAGAAFQTPSDCDLGASTILYVSSPTAGAIAEIEFWTFK